MQEETCCWLPRFSPPLQLYIYFLHSFCNSPCYSCQLPLQHFFGIFFLFFVFYFLPWYRSNILLGIPEGKLSTNIIYGRKKENPGDWPVAWSAICQQPVRVSSTSAAQILHLGSTRMPWICKTQDRIPETKSWGRHPSHLDESRWGPEHVANLKQ